MVETSKPEIPRMTSADMEHPKRALEQIVRRGFAVGSAANCADVADWLSSLAVAGGAPPEGKVSRTRIAIIDPDRPPSGPLTRVSRTAQAMAPHTDSTYLARPHGLVVFHMLKPDPDGGGASTLVNVDDVLPKLEPSTQRLLSLPVFPFGEDRFPILYAGSDGLRIRYYRKQIDRSLELGHPLPQNCLDALDALDTILANSGHTHKLFLEAEEMLLIANTRVLHGRSPLGPDSVRHMTRYRLHVPLLE